MNDGRIRSRVPPEAPLTVNRWLVAVRCYSLEMQKLGEGLGEDTSLRVTSVRTRAKVGASRQK